MLQKIFTKCRTAEIASCIGELIQLFNKSELIDEKYLSPLFAQLTIMHNQLINAVNHTKDTSELQEKDQERDNIFRSIVQFVKGATYNPVPAIQQAAIQIDTISDQYGLSIIKKSYAIESTLILSFIKDMSAEELQPSIEAVAGLSVLMQQLSDAQNEFESTFLNYIENQVQENDYKSATQITDDVLALFNGTIALYLCGMAAVNKEVYGEFVHTCDHIIGQTNAVAKRRSNKKKKETV